MGEIIWKVSFYIFCFIVIANWVNFHCTAYTAKDKTKLLVSSEWVLAMLKIKVHPENIVKHNNLFVYKQKNHTCVPNYS